MGLTITGYGSALYIGIAMAFVFPHVLENSILTFSIKSIYFQKFYNTEHVKSNQCTKYFTKLPLFVLIITKTNFGILPIVFFFFLLKLNHSSNTHESWCLQMSIRARDSSSNTPLTTRVISFAHNL